MSGVARFYQKKREIEREVEILMEDPYFNSKLLNKCENIKIGKQKQKLMQF